MERERFKTRVLLAVAGGLVLFAALLLGGGWVYDNVIQAGSTVAVVQGQTINLRDIAEEIRPAARAIESQARRSDPGGGSAARVDQQKRALPDQGLNALVENTFLRTEAANRGIAINSDDVDNAMRQDVASFDAPPGSAGLTPDGEDVSPAAVPTLDSNAYPDALKRYLDAIGIGETDYRRLLDRRVLREKVQDAVGADSAPATQEQVHARHILVADESAAEDVTRRLDGGEDFADLARQLSIDPGSRDKGGDLGWFPRGVMNDAFQTAAFDLQPGQHSAPAASPNGFEVIEVLERDPDRPVDPTLLRQVRARAFSDWLTRQRADSGVQAILQPAQRDWLLRQIGVRP